MLKVITSNSCVKCGPVLQILESLAPKYGFEVEEYNISVDEGARAYVMRHGVTSTPTVGFFDGEEEVVTPAPSDRKGLTKMLEGFRERMVDSL